MTLDTPAEKFVKACLEAGRYPSPEEIVAGALETLAQKEPSPQARKTPAEAVTHIRESRKGVTFGGLRIKDLIADGASTDARFRDERFGYAAMAL